jgi:hypothetical protein
MAIANAQAQSRRRPPKANSALWHIVITQMDYDWRTKASIERRMNDDQLTKKEAVRCFKRHVARVVSNLLRWSD